jgi:1-acyl-sn-glycerol-3-phosphate acyltransferase
VIEALCRTVATGGTTIGLTTVFAPIVSVISFKNERAPDPIIAFWAKSILAAAGVRPLVVGLENVPESNCVYVSNHQSHFDVLMIVAHIHRHIRFVAKAELYKIPLFGSALKATGNVKVFRSGTEADRQALAEAASTVRDRVNIVVFSEGTRSRDGAIGPFKKGAAVLAIQAQVPILPMAVAGTRDILPKGKRLIHGNQHAVLMIGKPRPTSGLTVDDREKLTEEIRQDVLSLYDEARRQLDAESRAVGQRSS